MFEIITLASNEYATETDYQHIFSLNTDQDVKIVRGNLGRIL